MSLMVHLENQQSHMTLRIEGTLDISTIQQFHVLVEQINEITALTIDFSKLEFIDSTGIGAIMDAIYLSQSEGFTIDFVGINEEVHEVFETIGLFQILEALQKGEG